MLKKILLSHPNGNANTRGVLEGLTRHDQLYAYVTSVALFRTSLWYNLTSIGSMREFRKRLYLDNLRDFTHCSPLKEIGKQIASKLKLFGLVESENSLFSTFNCYKYIDGKTKALLHKKYADIAAVYCYEDGALETFREAKRYGCLCIYDLPIGHWRYMRQIFEEERRKNPEWAITLGKFADSDKKLARKDEELRLADRIYVPSRFVKNSLSSYPHNLKDIVVIPFGCPKINKNRLHSIKEGKLKLLYVGSLTQRKGIAYLFKALEGLEDKFELTVIGGGRPDLCPALATALSRHKYLGTMPHEYVLEQMASHDIFVFPSLFEGFALVLNEALSQGTPCLTTKNAGIPDYFEDGKNSWIVETGSTEAIREKLLYLFENKEEVMNAGREALKTAAAHPWNEYEDRMSESIEMFINSYSNIV